MSPSPHPQAPIVVIGSGLAGWTTVRELRKLDVTCPITLVTADSGDFYAKPTLSNALAQKRTPEQLVTTPAASIAQTLGVTLLTHTRVESVDTTHFTVNFTVHHTQTTLPYRALVLATGAQAIRVPLQGNAANQVLSVNSLQDYSIFRDRLANTESSQNERQSHAPSVLIMGAGLIGCEFANDLASAGYRVRVVDPAARVLAALLPEDASTQLQSTLQGLGIKFDLGQTVIAVNRSASASGDALRITLSGGESIEADIVLSAIGLRADTALAQAAGIACERGVVVNTRLQTSAPGVYALGDSAQYQSAGNRTLPYVMPIMNAARALGATLAGQPTEVKFPLMPVAVKTPALPLTIAPPPPGTTGGWLASDAGEWHWLDDTGTLRGFTLAGAATLKRAKLAAAVVL
jgi:rubredoxin---NAD+ reductase